MIPPFDGESNDNRKLSPEGNRYWYIKCGTILFFSMHALMNFQCSVGHPNAKVSKYFKLLKCRFVIRQANLQSANRE